MLPTREEALVLLKEAGRQNPGKWVTHSLTAAFCAGEIAKRCNMEEEKAYVTGMLHDIGRRFGKGHFCHIVDGYHYMMDLGYDEAARICLTHSFVQQNTQDYIGDFDAAPDDMREMEIILEKLEFDDYDRLIQLCDCLSGADGVVSMEDRIADITLRYGKYPEAKKKKHMELRQYFENLGGADIYQIIEEGLLRIVSKKYQDILGDQFVGFYIHGSLAFDCFQFDRSDLDFIVAVKEPLDFKQKKDLISVLLDYTSYAPPKGFEMSVVLLEYCRNFKYPTPFELHFSNYYIDTCRDNIEEYCKRSNGTDEDLAAHFTVIRHTGYVLAGEPIENVFGEVPKSCYWKSLLYDIAQAKEQILSDPIYVILNLCRILAFRQEAGVLSKKQGGEWGLQNLPESFRILVNGALLSYAGQKLPDYSEAMLLEFADYMIKEIRG